VFVYGIIPHFKDTLASTNSKKNSRNSFPFRLRSAAWFYLHDHLAGGLAPVAGAGGAESVGLYNIDLSRLQSRKRGAGRRGFIGLQDDGALASASCQLYLCAPYIGGTLASRLPLFSRLTCHFPHLTTVFAHVARASPHIM